MAESCQNHAKLKFAKSNRLAAFLTTTLAIDRNGILLSKLLWPTMRKNCSSEREIFLKFEAEGREFAKILRSLEQWKTVKGQNNFW